MCVYVYCGLLLAGRVHAAKVVLPLKYHAKDTGHPTQPHYTATGQTSRVSLFLPISAENQPRQRQVPKLNSLLDFFKPRYMLPGYVCKRFYT